MDLDEQFEQIVALARDAATNAERAAMDQRTAADHLDHADRELAQLRALLQAVVPVGEVPDGLFAPVKA
jgi:hypothetical protein